MGLHDPAEIFVSIQQACMILPLWRQGKDTLEIAYTLAIPEYEVANRLPLLLERHRGEKEAMRGQRWTDEMDAELKMLHSGQYSCAQIAAKMERGLSRNAIIGRCHRLGLSGKAYVRSAPRMPRPKPTNTPVPRIVRANGNSGQLRVYESVESDVGELRCVEVVPRNISLVDLGTHDCRYPYGDGPFLFCGHLQAEASSYCPAHTPLTKAVVRMRMTQEQRLESRRSYMASYRASKRTLLEAAE